MGRTTRESGQITLHGRLRRSVTATSFIDTWLDADGALLLDKSAERSVDSYLDGKLVSHVVARDERRKTRPARIALRANRFRNGGQSLLGRLGPVEPIIHNRLFFARENVSKRPVTGTA